MPTTTIFSDNFNEANASSLGIGWADPAGYGTIVSNTAHINNSSNSPWANELYRRPETARDVVVSATRLAASASALYVVARNQDNGLAYFAGVAADGGIAYGVAGPGSNLGLLDATGISTPGSADVRIDLSVNGINPTVCRATVTNTTTNETNHFDWTDSTAGLQVTGHIGMFGYNGPCVVDNFSAVTTDSDAIPVTPSDTILSANGPNVTRSPYNWTEKTGNKLQAWNSGAYLRAYWTGSNTCKALLDQAGTQVPMQVRYRVDGGAWSNQVAVTTSTTEIVFAGITGTGSHSVELMLDASEQFGNRWAGVDSVLRVVGFNVGVGTGIAKVVHSKRAILYADSIWEGIEAKSGGGDSHVGTYGSLLALELRDNRDYEVGMVACGNGGWLYATPTNVPRGFDPAAPGTSWWKNVDNATARYTTGGASGWADGVPDLVVTEWGTNDALQNIPDVDVRASVDGFIAAMRTAAPNVDLAISVPVGQYKKAVLTAAVTAAISGGDTKTRLVDMGNDAAFNGWGLHPLFAQHAIINPKFQLLVFPPPALTGITVTHDALSGGTVAFHAAPVPSNAALGTVVWTTSSGTINASTGILTPPAPTSVDQVVTVTATSGSVSGTATYTVAAVVAPGTVATTTFSPGTNTYTGTQTVTLACATSGAVIHYTLDGSTPTSASPVYTVALTVAATQTVKAIGIKVGSTNSAVASATFTITPVSEGGTELTEDQAQTLASLASMIEIVSGVPRFKASALSILGISDGAAIPDITITGLSLNKNTFYRKGREILSVTIKAEGGDAPLQFAHMTYYLGFTAVNATEPPDVDDCIQVQPYANGSNIEVRVFIGTADATETIPVVDMAAGQQKVWVWALGKEKLINPAGTVTAI